MHRAIAVQLLLYVSGQLILANTAVERVNEGLVFKHTPINGLTITDDQQQQGSYEHADFEEDETFEGEGGDISGEQKLLSEKGELFLLLQFSHSTQNSGGVTSLMI